MKKRNRKGTVDFVAIIIMMVAIGVFFYAAYQLFLIFSEYHEGTREYDALRSYVYDTKEEEDGAEEPVIEANEIPDCPIRVDFSSLELINQDIVGWLYIEAIPQISYPIVQGEDNRYYLRHTVEKKENFSASIFMDCRNGADFRDFHTIIYGHNMKNQSMFGLLKKMKEPEVLAVSPYIWIVTEEETICYEVFSVRDVSENDTLYDLIQPEPQEYARQLEQAKQASEVMRDLTFHGTEQVITLSTCTGDDTVRCIVQAVRREF